MSTDRSSAEIIAALEALNNDTTPGPIPLCCRKSHVPCERDGRPTWTEYYMDGDIFVSRKCGKVEGVGFHSDVVPLLEAATDPLAELGVPPDIVVAVLDQWAELEDEE